MPSEIDQVVMKWQIAAFSGQTDLAKAYQEEYMKLVLEKGRIENQKTQWQEEKDLWRSLQDMRGLCHHCLTSNTETKINRATGKPVCVVGCGT